MCRSQSFPPPPSSSHFPVKGGCDLLMICNSNGLVVNYRRYVQHAHFILKRVWERKARTNCSIVTCQGSTRLELALGLLALCRRTLGSERHRYGMP